MNCLYPLDEDRLEVLCTLWRGLPLRVSLEFHGVRAAIATNEPRMVKLLEVGYGNFMDASVTEPFDFVSIAIAPGDESYWKAAERLVPRHQIGLPLLGVPSLGLLYVVGSVPLLQYYTVNTLFGQVVGALRRPFVVLHAAVVSRGQRGLVLCGAARCGKTVLTCMLRMRGWVHHSDDVTLLERTNLRIAPFPRGLNVRAEYADRVAPLLAQAGGGIPFDVADQHRVVSHLAYEPTPPVTPVHVVFPVWEQSEGARLEEIPKTDAFFTLMKERFYPIAGDLEPYQADDFVCIGELVERCDCMRLTYGSHDRAIERLLALP